MCDNGLAVSRDGDLVMRGNGTYSELFSAGSGNRYLSGFQGQLNIKHDGSGSVNIDSGVSKRTSAPCLATSHRPMLRILDCILFPACRSLRLFS